MSVTDGRRPPFCYQELAATRLIRESFTASRLATALAIYQSMTELANDQRTRDGFEATRAAIGRLAGCSPDTVDRYAKELIALGLLRRERRRHGNINLANLWTLTSPGDSRTGTATLGTDAATLGRAAAAGTGRTDAARPPRAGAAPLQEVPQEGEEPIPSPSQREGNHPPIFDKSNGRRRVRSEAAFAEWAAIRFPDVPTTKVAALAAALRDRGIEPTAEALVAESRQRGPAWSLDGPRLVAA